MKTRFSQGATRSILTLLCLCAAAGGVLASDGQRRFGEPGDEESYPLLNEADQRPYGTGYEQRFERIEALQRPERIERPPAPERLQRVQRPERPDRGAGRGR